MLWHRRPHARAEVAALPRTGAGLSRLAIVAAVLTAAAGATAQQRPPGLAVPPPRPTEPTIRVDTNVGMAVHRPGRWGLVAVRATNPTDEAQDWRLIFQYDDQPQNQYISRIWVPGGAQRRVMVPVRREPVVNARGGVGRRLADGLDVAVILAPAEEELELARGRAYVRQMPDDRPFLFLTDQPDRPDQLAVAELMSRIRGRARLREVVGYVRPHEVMVLEPAWDGIDTTIVSATRPRLSPAQALAVRRWLAGGGTLVVQADLVDTAAVRDILGDDWAVTTLDETTLDRLQWSDADGNALFEQDRERPVRFKRLVLDGFVTHLWVNGYPALAERPVGAGRIIVNAVSPDAWLDAPTDDALARLGSILFGPDVTAPPEPPGRLLVAQTPADQFVADQIGYGIMSRRALIGVLIAFIAAVGVSIAWFARRGRLEMGALATLVVSLVTLGALLAAGAAGRGGLEPTIASIQLVDAADGSDQAHVRSLSGFYDALGRTVRLESDTSGRPHSPLAARFGQVERIESADLTGWTLPSFTLPGGAIRPLRIDSSVNLARPLVAELRYGSEGLSGRLALPDGLAAEDVLVYADAAPMSVTSRGSADGGLELTATVDDVLPYGTLTDDALINESQRDRLTLLGATIEAAERRLFDRPVLLAWSPGLSLDLVCDPPMEQRSEALWAIPIEPRRASPGDRVAIPWPLVAMTERRELLAPAGLTGRAMYLGSTGRWVDEMFNPTAFVAEFTAPPQVRPLRIDGATIHLDISASGRTVRLLLWRDGAPVEIETLSGPDGAIAVEVPAELLAGATDTVTVAFDVGAIAVSAGNDSLSERWRVRRFGVELRGTVEPAGGATTTP